MNIHEVKRNTKRKRSTQVGRGGTRGKTSGRGHKGQKARSGGGGTARPEIRDRIKKLPKLRGRGVNINKPVSRSYAAVKLSDLQENFKSGSVVTPKAIFDAGLVRKIVGRVPKIKIVASGELTNKLTLKGVKLTKASKEAIEKAGGKSK